MGKVLERANLPLIWQISNQIGHWHRPCGYGFFAQLINCRCAAVVL
jgi:hypothetical protein